MTLKRKFLLRNSLLVILLLLLGASSIWGLQGLRRQVDLALFEYSNLRTIESAEATASTARTLLAADAPNVPLAIEKIQQVERLARSFGDNDTTGDGAALYNIEKGMSTFVAVRCEDAVAKLQDESPGPLQPQTRSQAIGTIDAMLGDCHQIASNCHDFIQRTQLAATARLRTTIGAMAG